MICSTPPGAGHGGRGGQSPTELSTGMPYGDLFEPFERGCRGGENGGRGGGIIYITILDRMQIDGEVSSNGEAGAPGFGGGSGGTVHIHANLIQVCTFPVIQPSQVC